jgi:hypothetical protein
VPVNRRRRRNYLDPEYGLLANSLANAAKKHLQSRKPPRAEPAQAILELDRVAGSSYPGTRGQNLVPELVTV